MSDKKHPAQSELRRLVRDGLEKAYDFDPLDPMVGLTAKELSGPVLERRTVLRLLAASGALTAAHLMPAIGVAPAAAASGGTLRCGWSGVGEFRTIDPAQINQVLLFQISSNVLSGLTHINPQLQAQGDLALDWDVNDAGTEYRSRRREGVTLLNGDPITGGDVVYAWRG